MKKKVARYVDSENKRCTSDGHGGAWKFSKSGTDNDSAPTKSGEIGYLLSTSNDEDGKTKKVFNES